jgi:NAD-dependent SIR2 family protein deacetylase
MVDTNNTIERAAELIAEADAIVITAGAGIGVDSGLPDFRGKAGFWRAYPMLKRKHLSFYEMASPEMFEKNPELAWGFYGQRLNLYRETEPHEGFSILKRWAYKMPAGYFISTSNVDGQFQKAGFDKNRIVEIHGSIHHIQTLSGSNNEILCAKNINVKVNPETLLAENIPYHTETNELLRPNILMFGDWQWLGGRAENQVDIMNAWIDKIKAQHAKVVIIELGAGSDIATVRYNSIALRDRLLGKLIQINPKPGNTANIVLKLGALEALQAIDKLLTRN